ncbi:MAG TPA: hypothetical protein VFD92_08230 [Candidatus Binatia bacterium]|nr:hypothetical protein [Candidatus Binatia bacterium]
MATPQHRWNHNNFAVAPEKLALVRECIDAVFPWVRFVDKPHLLGYRLSDDLYEGALYFRPVPAVAELEKLLHELRRERPELEGALAGIARADADYADHAGFRVASVAEWEERVAAIARIARERPEFELRVIDVLRPGDGRAPAPDLYQAFVRIGLLGPLRNTFEMQAIAR